MFKQEGRRLLRGPWKRTRKRFANDQWCNEKNPRDEEEVRRGPKKCVERYFQQPTTLFQKHKRECVTSYVEPLFVISTKKKKKKKIEKGKCANNKKVSSCGWWWVDGGKERLTTLDRPLERAKQLCDDCAVVLWEWICHVSWKGIFVGRNFCICMGGDTLQWSASSKWPKMGKLPHQKTFSLTG